LLAEIGIRTAEMQLLRMMDARLTSDVVDMCKTGSKHVMLPYDQVVLMPSAAES
jgi:hypothetical protein